MSDSLPPAALVKFRYRFGNVEFDEARFDLQVAGQKVAVQRKPLEILSLLLARAGEVVTKEELLEVIWDGRPTVENVVANAVTKLRGALGEGHAGRIVTLPRIGYRFDGPLERVVVGRALPSVLGLQAGQPVPQRPNFELQERIGQSASNEVWWARHVKTRERRVFKFCSEERQLALLKREVTLSRLLQDHLSERAVAFTRVLDWNFESPPCFIECEYVGEDLLRWANTGGRLEALSLPQRIDLFLQVADAVAAAHSIGVLHKDLKPANILVAEEGGGWRVRLADFGSSHLLDPQRLAELGITRLGFTMTGSLGADTLTGTPLYLAPELIAGQPPNVSADIYALGVILYQLIIGDLQRPLVPGWERAVPEPLLREDIARATDGDPAQRLRSVDELAGLLRGLAARQVQKQDETTLAAAQAQQEVGRRNRRMWILLVATALAGAVLAGAVATMRQNGNLATAASAADRRPVEVFYAGIMDVYRHYLFTDDELVSDAADRSFRLQLNLARYGDAPFERAQLDDIGLDPDEIPLAMELLLLIRNNDLRIADVLDDQRADAKIIAPQIETLRARVRATRDMAYSILERLHARDPRLGKLPPAPE